MSARYALITTPHCARCEVLKRLVMERGLTKLVEYVPAATPEGMSLRRQYNIMSGGVIIDREKKQLVEIDQIEEVKPGKW